MASFSDADLPAMRGIDPLHPLLDAFDGGVNELENWARHLGGGVYLYMLAGGGEGPIYIGVTRNPHMRFDKHRGYSSWWSRVTDAVVYRIDCRWHDGPVCSVSELDHAARYLEGWMVEMFDPTENLALAPVT